MALPILSAPRSGSPAMVAATKSVAGAGKWLEKACAAVAAYRARHRLASYGEAMLNDVGVPPCGIDWAVRNGRDR